MCHRGWVLVAAFAIAGCSNAAAPPEEGDSPTPADGSQGVPVADEDGGTAGDGGAAIAVGGQARVTADSLNLRDGIGTAANILTAMPCGTTVDVVGGPSTTPAAGWWNVVYNGQTGWASGKYLVAPAAFPADACGAVSTGIPTVDDIFARARLGVGYSYYWGHGSWRADGAQLGTCVGSCPSCTHTGAYGADCSGFVAKAWQVPGPSPIETDAHPYSTYNFYNETTHWQPIMRSAIKPADAMVHRSSSSGHIVLFESGSDPWGDVWVYEARGCATGIVHDLRTIDSTYIAIRRDGL
jgi:uncharacterized protein YraI